VIKNPKIIFLVFILAIFAFVNSEFNHVSKNTDQLAQIGRPWGGLFGLLQQKSVDIRLPNHDTRAQVEFSGQPISSISAQKIRAIAEEQLRKSKKSLGCTKSIYSNEAYIVLCNDHESYKKRAGVAGSLACFIQEDDTILIDLSRININLFNNELLEDIVRHECAHRIYGVLVDEIMRKNRPLKSDDPVYELLDKIYYNSRALDEGHATLQEQNNEILMNMLLRSIKVHSQSSANLEELIGGPYMSFNQGMFDQSLSFVVFLCIKYQSCRDGLTETIILSGGLRNPRQLDTTREKYKEKIKKLGDEWQAWESVILSGGNKSALEAIKKAKGFE